MLDDKLGSAPVKLIVPVTENVIVSAPLPVRAVCAAALVVVVRICDRFAERAISVVCEWTICRRVYGDSRHRGDGEGSFAVGDEIGRRVGRKGLTAISHPAFMRKHGPVHERNDAE
jgi:hypothetical protein